MLTNKLWYTNCKLRSINLGNVGSPALKVKFVNLLSTTKSPQWFSLIDRWIRYFKKDSCTQNNDEKTHESHKNVANDGRNTWNMIVQVKKAALDDPDATCDIFVIVGKDNLWEWKPITNENSMMCNYKVIETNSIGRVPLYIIPLSSLWPCLRVNQPW